MIQSDRPTDPGCIWDEDTLESAPSEPAPDLLVCEDESGALVALEADYLDLDEERWRQGRSR